MLEDRNDVEQIQWQRPLSRARANRAGRALDGYLRDADDTESAFLTFLVDFFHLAAWEGIDVSDEALTRLIHNARELNSREPQLVREAE